MTECCVSTLKAHELQHALKTLCFVSFVSAVGSGLPMDDNVFPTHAFMSNAPLFDVVTSLCDASMENNQCMILRVKVKSEWLGMLPQQWVQGLQ